MSTTEDLPIDNVATATERLAALMWDCDVAIADDEFTHAQWMVGYYPADLQPVFRRLSIRHRDTRPVLSVRVDDTLTASELGVVLHALYSVEPITTPEWKIPFRIEDLTYVLTISREHTFRVDEEGKDAVNDDNVIALGHTPDQNPALLSGLAGDHAGSAVDVNNHLVSSTSYPGENSVLFQHGRFPKTQSKSVFTYHVAALRGKVVEANITGTLPSELNLKTSDLLQMRIVLKEYLTQKYGVGMPDRVWYDLIVDPNNETVSISRQK